MRSDSDPGILTQNPKSPASPQKALCSHAPQVPFQIEAWLPGSPILPNHPKQPLYLPTSMLRLHASYSAAPRLPPSKSPPYWKFGLLPYLGYMATVSQSSGRSSTFLDFQFSLHKFALLPIKLHVKNAPAICTYGVRGTQ